MCWNLLAGVGRSECTIYPLCQRRWTNASIDAWQALCHWKTPSYKICIFFAEIYRFLWPFSGINFWFRWFECWISVWMIFDKLKFHPTINSIVTIWCCCQCCSCCYCCCCSCCYCYWRYCSSWRSTAREWFRCRAFWQHHRWPCSSHTTALEAFSMFFVCWAVSLRTWRPRRLNLHCNWCDSCYATDWPLENDGESYLWVVCLWRKHHHHHHCFVLSF